MGWDDNGLNVERRVQLLTGTIVDPTLPYDPDFRRPDERSTRRPGPIAGQPAQLHRAVRGGRARSSRRSTTSCGPTSGCRSTGTHTYTTIGPKATRTLAARVPAPRRAATSPTAASRRRCGTSTCARRWPRPSSRTARSPAPTTSSCSRAPTASRLLIDTTRPELLAGVRGRGRPPRRRALPAAVRPARHDAAVRRVRADRRPRAGRPREGHRRRDDLHVRRHHRRHRGGASCRCRCAPSSSATAGCARSPGATRAGSRRPRRRPGRLRRAGRQDRQAGPGPHRRAAQRGAGCIEGEIRADHPPGEVLGERHPPARDRHQPASGSSATRPRTRLLARGKELALVARLHAGPLRELGQRPHRRLEHHPPAVLRRAVPGLVPDRRRRRRRLPRARSWPTRPTLPDRPDHRRRRPATTSPSATSPAGSPPIPTSWTRGPRRR